MKPGTPHLVDTNALEWEVIERPWYSKPIRRKVLWQDAATGAVHLLIQYPPGLNAPLHYHSGAHTVLVLENELVINGKPYPPGTYARFAAGEAMTHTSTAQAPCTFLFMFDRTPDFIEVAPSGGDLAKPSGPG